MLPKILFVDDDPNLLAAFQRNLRRRFVFDTALGGEEALALLTSQGPYAVICADMRMPAMSGVELLETVRSIAPDTVRLMLTGNADQQTAIDAVNRGNVFGFLNKPCPPETLIPALETALKQHELLRTERELLEGTLAGVVKSLADVLGLVAPEALGRAQRLRDSMHALANTLPKASPWELEVTALLSLIGQASAPPIILRKMSAGTELSPAEDAIVQRFPQVGHDLLAGIPRLKRVAEGVLYQKKNYDGSGYPRDGLAGEAIPLGGRLLRILNRRLELEADGVVKQAAFVAMSAETGCFDPVLLQASFACHGAFLTSSLDATKPVQTLPVRALTPGQVVVSDITTPSGMVIVSGGHRLSQMIIERLRNHAELGDVREPVMVQDAPAISHESQPLRN